MHTFKALDILKFIMACLVVAIHTKVGYNTEMFYYIRSACRIAVPVFFCSSSFLFFFRMNRGGVSLYSYLKRLAILYLVWFIIELPYVINVFFIAPEMEAWKKIANFIRCVLLSNTFHASWYIVASMTAITIVRLLSKKLSNRTLLGISIILYSLALLSSSYYGMLGVGIIKKYLDYLFMIISPPNSFCSAVIYVVLGKYIADNFEIGIKPYDYYILGGSIILWIFEIILLRSYVRINDCFVLLPILAYVIVKIILNCKCKIGDRASKFLRNSSTIIYFVHYCFIELFLRYEAIQFGTKMYFLVLLGSVIVSSIVVQLSYKYKFFKVFF